MATPLCPTVWPCWAAGAADRPGTHCVGARILSHPLLPACTPGKPVQSVQVCQPRRCPAGAATRGQAPPRGSPPRLVGGLGSWRRELHAQSGLHPGQRDLRCLARLRPSVHRVHLWVRGCASVGWERPGGGVCRGRRHGFAPLGPSAASAGKRAQRAGQRFRGEEQLPLDARAAG